MTALFSVPISSIFTREMLEAGIIVGQYRQVVLRNVEMTKEEKDRALKNIWWSAGIAVILALVVVAALAIPLIILGDELNDQVVEIIEGVSKIVASLCIAQLSLKIPTWLGVYPSKPKVRKLGATLRTLRFNVGWNVWREVAEVGVFLIPFFIKGGAIAIPISALVGTIVGVVPAIGIYFANKHTKHQGALAFSCSFLLGWLAVGLMTGGCHEFEEALGETPKVFKIEGDFWYHKNYPMAIFKPFGYSASPTVLMICAFWISTFVLVSLHVLKYWYTNKKYGKTQDGDDNSGEEGAAAEPKMVGGKLYSLDSDNNSVVLCSPTSTSSTDGVLQRSELWNDKKKMSTKYEQDTTSCEPNNHNNDTDIKMDIV